MYGSFVHKEMGKKSRKTSKSGDPSPPLVFLFRVDKERFIFHCIQKKREVGEIGI